MTSRRIDLLAVALWGTGAIAVMLAAIWPLTADRLSGLGDAVAVVLTALPFTLAWLAGAWGFGRAAARWFAHSLDAASHQFAVGAAILMFFDSLLGRIGWLFAFHGLGAWIVTLMGIGLLALDAWWRSRNETAQVEPRTSLGSIASLWPASLSIGILALATAWAPGFLWGTEFGGYDALSYHLQLPKEWMAAGHIHGLEHNVYSFLPGFMEAAYAHLAAMRGDAMCSATACQLLHASFMVLTAMTLCRIGLRSVDAGADAHTHSAAPAILLLGTPWIVVTGSLAYDEGPALLFLAAGMSLLLDERIDSARLAVPEPMDKPWHPFSHRTTALAGLLAGAACGAKLTALMFAALPLGLLLSWGTPARMWPSRATVFLLVMAAVLAPWWIANWVQTGNPVFPMAAGVLGEAHWTAAQAATWNSGHISSASLLDRIALLWNQFLRFGIGPNPAPALAPGFDPAETWRAQWSILPWIGLAGLIVAMKSAKHDRLSQRVLLVLLVQVLMWLAFTHLKSRFLLPAAIPLCIGAALGWRAITERQAPSSGVAIRSNRFAIISGTLAVVAWSLQPLIIYRMEHAPAATALVSDPILLTGNNLTVDQRVDLADAGIAAVFVNHLLPGGSRVLFLGEAAPFYYTQGNFTYNTVWDRSVIADLMRDRPDAPEAWVDQLSAMGYTHLLVNRTMLAIWRREGWLDPALTETSVNQLISRLPLEHWQFNGGIEVYSIPAWRPGREMR